MGGKLSPTENLIVVKADKTQGSGDYQVPANPWNTAITTTPSSSSINLSLPRSLSLSFSLYLFSFCFYFFSRLYLLCLCIQYVSIGLSCLLFFFPFSLYSKHCNTPKNSQKIETVKIELSEIAFKKESGWRKKEADIGWQRCGQIHP